MTPLRQARNDLARITAHGHVELAAHATAALERLTAWNTHGYPSSGSSGRGSDVADPTATAAVAPDPIGNWIQATCQAIHQIATGLDDLDRSAAWSRIMTPKQVLATLANARPTGTCRDCGRTVACTAVDRLRAGFCMACYAKDRRARVTTSNEQVIAQSHIER